MRGARWSERPPGCALILARALRLQGARSDQSGRSCRRPRPARPIVGDAPSVRILDEQDRRRVRCGYDGRMKHRSFWLQEVAGDAPDAAPLDGARRADVAIIGGGYVGLWTAIRIKEREPVHARGIGPQYARPVRSGLPVLT